jgi:ribosome biogenesis GTPase
VNDLVSLGYGPFFSQQLDLEADAGLLPARVLVDLGARLRLGLGQDGGVEERLALLPASLRGRAAVGDWVLCEPLPGGEAVLRRVLDRRTALSRQAAGEATGEQVLAANVDLVLLVEALGAGAEGPNWRRLERTLAAARASGAEVAVVLTKADRCGPGEAEAAVAEAARLAPGAGVVAVRALDGAGGAGLDGLRGLLAPGATAVLLGQSGAGKSTLLNALLGEAAEATGEVAADGRGRHTTAWRRLWRLPGGALLVDGPGIRELQLWDGAGLAAAFADVGDLAAGCRFSDCVHEGEPGCAVQAAVEAGALPAERLQSFHKLAREAAALAARHDAAARQAERREGKARQRALRTLYRSRGR